jgi:hypothetical protein
MADLQYQTNVSAKGFHGAPKGTLIIVSEAKQSTSSNCSTVQSRALK